MTAVAAAPLATAAVAAAIAANSGWWWRRQCFGQHEWRHAAGGRWGNSRWGVAEGMVGAAASLRRVHHSG